MSEVYRGPVTRKMACCPIIGQPEDLAPYNLPTFGAILKAYLWYRHNDKITKQDPPHQLIAQKLISNLINIWESASIPIVSKRRIEDMLKDFHTQYKNLLKVNIDRRNSAAFKEKLECFQQKATQLFDIACCKCTDFENCKCIKEKKVPQAEQVFLWDQRGQRRMVIGGVDQKTTVANLNRNARLERQESYRHKMQSKMNLEQSSTNGSSSSNSEASDISDFEKELPKRMSSSQKKRIKDFPSLGGICDRTGVSNRSAALIATSVLQDADIVTEENKDSIIDRHKISRERSKARKTLKLSCKQLPIKALYFDGRKDKTLTQSKKGPKLSLEFISEEHITMLLEPGSEFLGHVSPNSGCALNITTAMINYLNKESIEMNELKVIGCDGTATNTGAKNGIIASIENKIGRSLQWIICLLHGNELPLRHLVNSLDGKTSGPSGYTGEIGKKLNDCEKRPVVDYKPVHSEFFENFQTLSDISYDQKYLLDISVAVSQGICDESLATRDPGKMANSRWVTTANRILRLYVASQNPSPELIEIVDFVMHVYSPMWFKIKSQPSVLYGTRHIHETIFRMRSLSVRTQEIVKKVIQRNGYFCHPENILISMITDEKSYIRELGWHRILKARRTFEGEIRTFKVPKINFDAENYYKLIDWQEEIWEPPLTKDLSENHIEEIIKSGEIYQGIPDIPCHTQAVERHVTLVTEAAGKVCGEERRDGYIRVTIASRKKIPSFENKREFKL